MKATEQLMAEHETVLVALELLDRVGNAIAAGKAAAPGHLDQLLDFLKGFVDRCHHGKEEDVLFPELEKLGLARDGGPIGVMLSEHVGGRGHIRALGDALARLRAGDRTASEAIRQNVSAYRALLQAHIQKENSVLFPMADRLVPADAVAGIVDRFEAIERDRLGEGKHETYHAMLHDLGSTYGLD